MRASLENSPNAALMATTDQAGVAPEALQAQLGHADISTTLGTTPMQGMIGRRQPLRLSDLWAKVLPLNLNVTPAGYTSRANRLE